MSKRMHLDDNCYICHPDQWSCEKCKYEITELPEIVQFRKTMHDSVKTLDGLISKIEAFVRIKTQIIDILTDEHTDHTNHSTAPKKKQRAVAASVSNSNSLSSIFAPSAAITNWDLAVYKVLMFTDQKVWITLTRLTRMLPEIKNISRMIGIDELKDQFTEQLIYLACRDPAEESPMMHTVITGPPGHGKTEIAKLIGKAYRASGFLSNDKFICAKRADLIGSYLGQTAPQTTAIFKKAKGGVIFIDEAYSLGDEKNGDMYSKECIDTINQILSEDTDTLCIIAGYEKELQERFFSYNQGLARRFTWTFTIKSYAKEDLIKIFHKLVADIKYTLENDNVILCDDINMDYFSNAGGDMYKLLTNCRIKHHVNCFLKEQNNVLTRKDIEDGLKKFYSHKRVAKKEDTHLSMYI